MRKLNRSWGVVSPLSAAVGINVLLDMLGIMTITLEVNLNRIMGIRTEELSFERGNRAILDFVG